MRTRLTEESPTELPEELPDEFYLGQFGVQAATISSRFSAALTIAKTQEVAKRLFSGAKGSVFQAIVNIKDTEAVDWKSDGEMYQDCTRVNKELDKLFIKFLANEQQPEIQHIYVRLVDPPNVDPNPSEGLVYQDEDGHYYEVYRELFTGRKDSGPSEEESWETRDAIIIILPKGERECNGMMFPASYLTEK